MQSFNSERQRQIQDLDMNDLDNLEFFRQQLLSKRDQKAEMFIKKLMTTADQ